VGTAIQVVTGDARAQSCPSRSGSSQRLCSVLAVLAEFLLICEA
jgi:hypothetical protein